MIAAWGVTLTFQILGLTGEMTMRSQNFVLMDPPTARLMAIPPPFLYFLISKGLH
jgi:hypothetical protein